MTDQPHLPGYDLLRQLGAGGVGQVWAVRRADGVRFAAKFVTDVEGAGDVLRHEATLLRDLRHEHVVRLHEVVHLEDDAVVLVMQLAEGGSLADSLRTRDHLTPGELVTVLCPVARALHDLHAMGLIHGDLSPGNLLFTQEGKPLIADLGFSRLAGDNDSPDWDQWGTESWAAPEVMAGETMTPASDVYSLGALAWTAMVGSAPGPSALRPDLVDVAPSLSPGLHDLILACLSHAPQSRPTPEEFALTLWKVAPADPAPVQGSPGRRTADVQPTDDPGFALTRRIRDDAERESAGRHRAEAVMARPVWRRTATLRTLGAAVFVGLVAGALMLTGNTNSARAGTEVRTGVRTGVRTTVAAASSTPTPYRSAPRRSEPSRSDPSRSATTSGPSRSAPAESKTLLSSQQRLQADPAGVLQRLIDARARVWVTGHASELSTSVLPGSAAYRADTADLATVRRRGTQYFGLSFQVRGARLIDRTSPKPQIQATADRSAYVVREESRSTSIAARPGQRTRIALSLTAAGWRITSWAAP